jgi:hypothetical protein
VIQHRISGEIIGHFAEAGFQTRLAPGTADPGFGVANNSGGSIGHAARDQRLDREIRRRGITARIRNQACTANALAAELWQAIDRLAQQLRRRVLLFVPARIRGCIAQAKRATEIDYLGSGVEQTRHKIHGDFGRRSEKHDGETLGAHRVGIRGSATKLRMVDRSRPGSRILTMFQQDWLDVGMRAEQANEFGATVPAEADDAHLIFIHHSE